VLLVSERGRGDVWLFVDIYHQLIFSLVTPSDNLNDRKDGEAEEERGHTAESAFR
jgi:hypothetical protein